MWMDRVRDETKYKTQGTYHDVKIMERFKSGALVAEGTGEIRSRGVVSDSICSYRPVLRRQTL